MEVSSFLTMLEESHFIDLHKLQQKYSVVKTNELLSILSRYFYAKADLKLNNYHLVFMPHFTRIDSRIFTSSYNHSAENLTSVHLLCKALETLNASQASNKSASEQAITKLETPLKRAENLLTAYLNANKSSPISTKKFLEQVLKIETENMTSQETQNLKQLINSDMLNLEAEDNNKPLAHMTVLLAFLTFSFDDDFLSQYISWLAAVIFLLENNFSPTFAQSLFINSWQQPEYWENYTNKLDLIIKNASISKVIDVTPLFNFIFSLHYKVSIDTNWQLTFPQQANYEKTVTSTDEELPQKLSLFTEKQIQLWEYVSNNYQNEDFTIQKLERDFSEAAYATVRSFVLKFVEEGLLEGQKYANKVKYRIKK